MAIYKLWRDPLEETSPVGTLISDVQPPELWANKSLLLSHQVYGTLFWQLYLKLASFDEVRLCSGFVGIPCL